MNFLVLPEIVWHARFEHKMLNVQYTEKLFCA